MGSWVSSRFETVSATVPFSVFSSAPLALTCTVVACEAMESVTGRRCSCREARVLEMMTSEKPSWWMVTL